MEIIFTVARLSQLQERPVRGKFDFEHLKKIHGYIFRDIYDWAGRTRTVEIGKGNLFCLCRYIDSYAESVFDRLFEKCAQNRENPEKFRKTLAERYADINALHPFREGNGRTQREFARELCDACGYHFDLSKTTHEEMLEASILSFNTGDTAGFERIFAEIIVPKDRKRREEG